MFTLAFSLADDKVQTKKGFPSLDDAMDNALRQYRHRRAEGWKFAQVTDAKNVTVATPETFDEYRKSKGRAA